MITTPSFEAQVAELEQHWMRDARWSGIATWASKLRSEEHTSELQSRLHLVCRLLPEKKRRTPMSAPPPTPQVGSSQPSPRLSATRLHRVTRCHPLVFSAHLSRLALRCHVLLLPMW